MENGWTGGQYSVLRASAGLLAAARLTAVFFETAAEDPLTTGLGGLAALTLACGFRARIAAVLTAVALIMTAPPLAPPALVCAWHALVPPAPFGSLAARGRADPAGGWRMPGPVLGLARGVLVLQVVAVVYEGPTGWGLAALFLAGIAACDPAWIRPRAAAGPDRVFYDGDCGLCHRTVRFLLAEERTGAAFRFAPLGGPTFEEALSAEERAALPDSIVVVTPEGEPRQRSAAVLHMLSQLGGGWRVLAAVLGLIPRALRDLAYDLVARVRGRLFARPDASCPVLSPELGQRFEP